MAWNICRFAVATSFFTSYMLCLASLLTSTAISVERFVVLLLNLIIITIIIITIKIIIFEFV